MINEELKERVRIWYSFYPMNDDREALEEVMEILDAYFLWKKQAKKISENASDGDLWKFPMPEECAVEMRDLIYDIQKGIL